MNGNITKDGIQKDLAWMKRIGLGGFHNFDASLSTPQIVDQRLIYMDEGWKDAFAYASQQADSLGLEMTVASAPGWSATGGPWVEPKDAMKKLVWRTMEISGGSKIDVVLPEPFKTTGAFQNSRPEGRGEAGSKEYYEDVAVIALKISEAERSLEDLNVTAYANGKQIDLLQLIDDDVMNGVCLPVVASGFSYLMYEFPEEVTIKSMTLAGGSNTGMTFESSQDGKTFTEVCPVRKGSVVQTTISLPESTGKYFRLRINNPKAAPDPFFGLGGKAPEPKETKISEWKLHRVTCVNFVEEKAAFKATGNLAKRATPVIHDEVFAKTEEIIDITDNVNDNKLEWDAPEGYWRIYRFGYSLTGKMNHPAPPEATGLEVDKLDPVAWTKYFHTYLNMYKEASKGLIGNRGIQYVLTDSYEAEHMTWTQAMFEEFKNRRGYDLHQWLPVLTGVVVDTPERSDAFLRDWRKTIGELIKENYDLLSEIAKRDYGMKGRYCESHEGGRAYVVDGMDVKQTAEVPMSAMWCCAPWLGKLSDGSVNRLVYKADDRESASVAHIFGQNIAAAESMTAWGEVGYSFCPENLKELADVELSEGINRFVIHESAHQPVDDKVPGLSLGGIGQWFNRHDTWAEQAKAWVDYMSRSCFMLQQGKNVADILVYYGEDDNITSLYSNGAPAVPSGYQYDYCSASALSIMSYENGKITSTASGTQYQLLWLDRNLDYMSISVLKKIAELAKAGALIGGEKPLYPFGLNESKEEFDKLVSEIWGGQYQNVSTGKSMEDVLVEAGIEKDIVMEDCMRYLHRSLQDAEIYWVNRPVDEAKKVEVSFRITGREPKLWHPETGKIEAVSYKIAEGRTRVTIPFSPNDAVFVVFGIAATQNEVVLPKKQENVVLTVNTPWTVTFQENRGAPTMTKFAELKSWTESEEFGIKYFSGTATYKNTINVSKFDGRAIIDLGEVKNLAEVIVNGKSAGIIWKQPFRADITELLHDGENQLEIKVTNLWVNRLIGDQQPECKQKVTFTDAHYYNPTAPLLPSGLIGPVCLIEQK